MTIIATKQTLGEQIAFAFICLVFANVDILQYPIKDAKVI